jgi:hypothetical protein
MMNNVFKSKQPSFLCRQLMTVLLALMLMCCFQPSFATPTTPTSDFIDNSDGTVTHKLTGLVWMRCAMGQAWDKATASCTGTATEYTWDAAMALKSNSTGHSDWRLPNSWELHTIVERENVNPAINSAIFPNTPTGTNIFWTSSPYAYNADQTWIIDFHSGYNSYASGFSFLVRLVRGGNSAFSSLPLTTPTVDFIDHGNGTVTHKRTGLMWQRCAVGQTWTGSGCSGNPTSYSWNAAMALTNDLGGYNDWHMPTQNELQTLVEYGKYAPSINNKIFPDTPSKFFWSSSPKVADIGPAWLVTFKDGSDWGYDENSWYFVRLVRGKWIPKIATYDINTQSTLSVYFGKNYDAKNAKIIELKNTSTKAITVNNVITSDAGSYWVNLFIDSKWACRPLNYTQANKSFTIPANSSCQISIGFSPFDNLTAGKTIPASITLKTVINGTATNKVINVTGIGRAQVTNAYNNDSSLWGQNTWGMAELKRGNPPINATLVGAANRYGVAKFWYGGVIDATLQKTTASVGNLVVFASNSVSQAGHVGVVIQTSPVVTMLSMNDIKDQNGVKVRKWSVRPVNWYPNNSSTLTWSPLITGFNTTAPRHYGFVDWNSGLY